METYRRYYGLDFWEWLADNLEAVIGSSIIIAILLFVLFLYLVWKFIKSAVQRGVEDALQTTPQKTSFRPYIMTECVKEGVLQALKELETTKSEQSKYESETHT